MKNANDLLCNSHIPLSFHPVITALGICTRNEPGLVVRNRPFNGYLVMCFRNRFFATTERGRAEGGAGDCIIHPPYYEQEHGPANDNPLGYIDDWFRVNWAGIPPLLQEYDLPLNTIIHTGVANLLEPFLTKIQLEVYEKAPFTDRAVSLRLELLLMEIARRKSALAASDKLSHADVVIRSRLQEIRVQVHQRFEKPWTVADMARLANLSPGYFATRYSDFFNVSPINDLIDCRIRAAQQWLQEEHGGIAAIAERAGFSDVYYFSRTFMKRVGCPPGEYRKHFSSRAGRHFKGAAPISTSPRSV